MKHPPREQRALGLALPLTTLTTLQRGLQLYDAIVFGGHALLLGERQALRPHGFLPRARAGKMDIVRHRDHCACLPPTALRYRTVAASVPSTDSCAGAA